MYETLSIMGYQLPINWLAGFQPSTVPRQDWFFISVVHRLTARLHQSRTHSLESLKRDPLERPVEIQGAVVWVMWDVHWLVHGSIYFEGQED